jgi:hypothetical protein
VKLKNEFSINTRHIFLYVTACFNCGKSSEGLELHHILGRISNSPLNACPLCKFCHESTARNYEKKKEYLVTTIKFLLANGYEFTEKDILFFNENKLLYKNNLSSASKTR